MGFDSRFTCVYFGFVLRCLYILNRNFVYLSGFGAISRMYITIGYCLSRNCYNILYTQINQNHPRALVPIYSGSAQHVVSFHYKYYLSLHLYHQSLCRQISSYYSYRHPAYYYGVKYFKLTPKSHHIILHPSYYHL